MRRHLTPVLWQALYLLSHLLPDWKVPQRLLIYFLKDYQRNCTENALHWRRSFVLRVSVCCGKMCDSSVLTATRILARDPAALGELENSGLSRQLAQRS